MKKEFKRIRNHAIEYFIIMSIFFIMSIISLLCIFSDNIKGETPITAIVLFIVFSFLLIYLFYLWYSFFNLYRKIKKIKTEETFNQKIKINSISFVYYKAKHYCGASAMKICCIIDGNEDILYYIFKEDTIFYKNIKGMMNGYIDVSIYDNSKIINSLGSKLDKKVNF